MFKLKAVMESFGACKVKHKWVAIHRSSFYGAYSKCKKCGSRQILQNDVICHDLDVEWLNEV